MSKLLVQSLAGFLLLLLLVASSAIGQTVTTDTTTTSSSFAANETSGTSSSDAPVTTSTLASDSTVTGGPTGSSSISSSISSETTAGTSSAAVTTTTPSGPATTAAPVADPGPALYKLCAARNGTICYGDKPNCIKNANCTFLGAIRENSTIINIKVLTRVYDPPYDGVNLTVELLSDKKDNGSVLRCTRPRFKSFKIRLSWKNKTSFEVPDQPGNETQLAETTINKEDLQKECEQDLSGNILPSQTLALKFYIANNNTLVSQGLTPVDLQDGGKNSDAGSDRQGRKLDSPPPSKEDLLYEMCLKNTAKCFGDRTGCTEGHNCTILGVIRESKDNYHVYLVTKSYNPPVSNINLTLTLNTTVSNGTLESSGMSLNSTETPTSPETDECHNADFKDLSIQSLWMAKEIPQATNGSEVLETVVDKSTIQSRCQSNLRALKMTNSSSDLEETLGETLNFFLKFHLENGTLVPLDISNGLDDESLSQKGTFQIGRNGTAYLVSENTAEVVPSNDDDGLSQGSSTAGNGSRALSASYFTTTCLTLILPCFLLLNLFK